MKNKNQRACEHQQTCSYFLKRILLLKCANILQENPESLGCKCR